MNLRHFTIRFSSVALPAVILAFALDCSAQTLADIARKERERRKQLQPVVTVTSRPAGAASVSSTGTGATTPAVVPVPSPPAVAQQPAGPLDNLDNRGWDEKYWRDTFQKTRDALKRAEDRVQVTDLRVKELNKQLYQNSGIYNRENQLAPEITAAQRDLEAARLEVELGRQRILSLEDELRRAGGLPGWAR